MDEIPLFGYKPYLTSYNGVIVVVLSGSVSGGGQHSFVHMDPCLS